VLYVQWLCEKKDGIKDAVPVGKLQETLPSVTRSKMNMNISQGELDSALPDIFTSGESIKRLWQENSGTSSKKKSLV